MKRLFFGLACLALWAMVGVAWFFWIYEPFKATGTAIATFAALQFVAGTIVALVCATQVLGIARALVATSEDVTTGRA